MLDILSKLSPKLDKTLPAIRIGSIITAAVYNHPTSLQIDLGIVIRNFKKLINLRHAFGVTCYYEDVCVSRNQLLCHSPKFPKVFGVITQLESVIPCDDKSTIKPSTIENS